MSKPIYKIIETRYWLSDTPEEGTDMTCAEVNIETIHPLELARLLDNRLEDSNHHSISGLYERLYDVLCDSEFGMNKLRAVFIKIYEKGGLFNA